MRLGVMDVAMPVSGNETGAGGRPHTFLEEPSCPLRLPRFLDRLRPFSSTQLTAFSPRRYLASRLSNKKIRPIVAVFCCLTGTAK